MSLITRCDKCKREQDDISSMCSPEFTPIGRFRVSYSPRDFPEEHKGGNVDLCLECYNKIKLLLTSWLRENGK